MNRCPHCHRNLPENEFGFSRIDPNKVGGTLHSDWCSACWADNQNLIRQPVPRVYYDAWYGEHDFYLAVPEVEAADDGSFGYIG